MGEETPEVAAAYDATHSHSVMTPQVAYSYLPYAVNYGYHNVPAAPVVPAYQQAAVAAPVAATVAAAAPVSSQFHAQDEAGSYSYGYNSDTQAKTEVKSPDGVTRGSYSYVDANGLLQTVQYISDAMGFRVAATNLPVHHVGEGAASTAPESGVEAAKYDAGTVLTPSVNYAYLPYASNYGYAQPAPALAVAPGGVEV